MSRSFLTCCGSALPKSVFGLLRKWLAVQCKSIRARMTHYGIPMAAFAVVHNVARICAIA
jgi:hypothetical protein